MRVLLLIGALSAVVSGGPIFTIRSIGPPDSVATAVSRSAVVSGYYNLPDGSRNAFVFDGTTTMLGANAGALDISADGVVVGNVWTSAGSRAVVWEGGAARWLAAMDSYALGVNDAGTVVGSGDRDGRTMAFVSGSEGTMWIQAGEWAAAYDINDLGQVAGTYRNSRGEFSGFTWSEDGGFREIGRRTWAQSVNNLGAIAGSMVAGSGYLHAFVYGTALTDLGTLGGTTSAAYDINDSGEVVGYAFDREGRSRAFVWRRGMLLDLNQLIDPASGWSLEAAYGINSSGQIAGTGRWNGERSAFLLAPGIPPSMSHRTLSMDLATADVPEPNTCVLLLIASGVMLAARTVKNS